MMKQMVKYVRLCKTVQSLFCEANKDFPSLAKAIKAQPDQNSVMKSCEI